MSRIEIMQTGRAMKNHVPHEGCGRMFWSAIIFCGEAIGDAAPPILDASAIPRISALEKFESAGRFLSMGWIIEKQRTGAATFEIHMLRNMPTNMFVISTVLGRVPALLRTRVAIILAMWYFESAAAMVKPPSKSMMTGVHIEAKTNCVESFVSNRW